MLASVASRLTNNLKSKQLSHFRSILQCNFASMDQEPHYAVGDDAMDPKLIKLPYLDDVARMEIYNKYKSDPKTWNFSKLATYYSASEMRIKAIVYLMKTREELRNSLVHNETEARDIQIWNKSKEPEVTPATLATEFSLSENDVNDILNRMKEHSIRQESYETMSNRKDKDISELSSMGVNTKFAEIPAYVRGNLADNYFPYLFGDNELEAAKKKLLYRLKQETLASLKTDPALDFLREKFGDDAEVDIDGNVVVGENVVKREDIVPLPKTEPKPTGTKLESRFKFAFRDTSIPPTLQKTVVRTRTGEFRNPTPVEELGRTWTKKPSKIDSVFFQEKMLQYKDFDGDEHLVLVHFKNRVERRKSLLSAKAKK